MRPSRRVIGIDGCADGWIVVTASDSTSGGSSVRFTAQLDAEIEAYRRGDIDAIAIDMPIGLPARAPRPSDAAARALLGDRRSTVFPTPARATLGATDFDDALRRSRAAIGVGLSKQAFNLLPKIRQLDALLVPADQPRISEAHPELSFRAMTGNPLSKKTSTAGIAQRIAALLPHMPDLLEQMSAAPSHGKPDDVLDAYALAWTARRMAAGQAEQLGAAHDLDERGMRMTIAI